MPIINLSVLDTDYLLHRHLTGTVKKCWTVSGQYWGVGAKEHVSGPRTSSPCTTRRPSAVRLILVPGRLAAHTYTPECCRDTSEIIRFPVPRTWMPSTPMERPSDGHTDTEIVHEIKPLWLVNLFFTFCWDAPGLPSLLQETMGLGFPVAIHSKMAVWWTVMVRFWGPDRITGSL